MRRQLSFLVAAAAALPVAGCSNSSNNLLGGVPAIAYISRVPPADTGNVFDYQAAGSNGNIYTLTPPTADGLKVNITNWGTGGDVNAMDVSFDAREIAFSGKAPGDSNFHIFRINVDGSNPCDAAKGKVTKGACQLTDGPNDEVYPLYIPGGRIMFVTNRNVEGAAVPQFRDEYERATTAQAASMKLDGSDMILGPRNVSHRVAPALLSDGRIIATEWRHLGDTNEGDLTILNQDLTGVKEGFGREGKGICNSYLHAKEISPGKIVTICTSRDRTYQAGAIAVLDLGGTDITEQSEARSSAQNLTPLVPLDNTPSFNGVGRFYDVNVINHSATRFLASWSDGPVNTTVLAMAHAAPDFGIYVYDASTQTRYPIVNEVGSWEVSAMPIVARTEPPQLQPLFPDTGSSATLLSAINVFDSTMFPNMPKGSISKVRITEGFSSEEGVPNMFGLSEFDGQARLGEFDLNADGSFKATIPANTPVRIQLIDKFAMALATPGAPGGSNASEPLWIQGRPGEARVCGGCHESRTESITLAPGSSTLQAAGAAPLDYPGVARKDRKSSDFSYDKVMGVPWDQAIQPIYDAHCIDCHDGTPGAANPSYTLMDLTDMTTFSMTFDLTSKPKTIMAGDMTYTYPSSYISILGPSMAFEEKNIMVTMGTLASYLTPGVAATSQEIQMLNPPQQFPTYDDTVRAYPSMPVHPAEVGTYNGHDGADPKYQLTQNEYYLLILNADDGGQFYFRENAPGGSY
jgi:hypothetical protein